ncbi:hypothetical protein [Chryseobacterium vaccae]|uniref:hypothetical protein n=1 Tax=Chryseobacterium vaccae TaxID=2604424 RepID=UPI001297BF04|nr:hypothetical protein [Chryseobacterium vaccae]
MKIIYFKDIQYVISQASDASFERDLYRAYNIRFNEIKEEIMGIKDHDLFFQRFRESLKITLNNLEKVSLFQFFFLEDLAPSDKNEGLQEIFFMIWNIFFRMKAGRMKAIKVFLLRQTMKSIFNFRIFNF